VRDLRLRLDFEPEETIWTESSYKFTRRRVRAELQAAGLRLEAWLSDPEGRFALALARSR
jgi:L-histidine Nalpha-methyltransferase